MKKHKQKNQTKTRKNDPCASRNYKNKIKSKHQHSQNVRKYEFKYSHRIDVQFFFFYPLKATNCIAALSLIKKKEFPFKRKTNRQTSRKKSILKVYGSKPVEGFDWMAGS